MSRNLVWYCFIAVLAFCYLLQVFTPLRLNVDSMALLYLAESAAQGNGFLDHGATTPFPPGYPAMLLVLIKTGLAHPAAFVALNVTLLSVGLLAFCYVLHQSFFRENIPILNSVCLTLLSWVVIRGCTFPLTDVPFFSVAMCGLAAITYLGKLNAGLKLALWIFVSWLSILASMVIRRVGVALIPALMYAIVSHSGIRRQARLLSFRAAAVFLIAAAGIVAAITKTYTLHDFGVIAGGFPPMRLAITIASFRVTELGELAVNLPMLKLPAVFRLAMIFAGLALLALAIYGLWRKRSAFGPVEVFFLSYAAILFAWPYYDPRFWLPVVPLLIAYVTYGLRDFWRFSWFRQAVIAYELLIAITGVVALGYSTKLTFAGARFADEYVGGTMRDTYCAAYSCVDGFRADRVDSRALHLLQVFR